LLIESTIEDSDNKLGRNARKLKLLAILMLAIALVASSVIIPTSIISTSVEPVSTRKRMGLTLLQEIYSDSSSWINKTVLVEGRLYVYLHPGWIYQSIAPVDYVLVDSNNIQMPISSDGVTMPLSWSMQNVPTVDCGIFQGPYALVWLKGIVKNTTAGDLLFFPALYILTSNVTNLSNDTS